MKNDTISEYEKNMVEMVKNEIRKNTTHSSLNSETQKEEEEM